MKFCTLREVSLEKSGRVFNASPTREGVPFIIFLGLTASLLLLASGKLKPHGVSLPPPVFIYIAAATLGLFSWLAFGRFRASIKPTNWLLRCDDDAVVIKYRSFLNWRFPADDIQAVSFDYSEIAWIRMTREQRISPSANEYGGSARQTRRLVYLDFCLANTDTSVLEMRLQAERMSKPAGLTISMDYPVEVVPTAIVRVRWNGITPSIHQALAYLGRRLKIADSESTKLDLTRQGNISPSEDDAKIIALLRCGDKMGAVTLARQIHGFTLSEAVEFVDKLR